MVEIVGRNAMDRAGASVALLSWMSTITLDPQLSFQRRSVRLTRRGRLVVFAVGVLLAFALGVWLAAGSVATHEAGVEQVEIVKVAPGETLWDIAADKQIVELPTHARKEGMLPPGEVRHAAA